MALTVKVTTAPEALVASAVMDSGRESSGGCDEPFGITVKDAGPIERVPPLSIASTVTETVPGTERTKSGMLTKRIVPSVAPGLAPTVTVPKGPDRRT